MKHPSHDHALVLNENYIAREGDICRGCSEQIFSSKSWVYSCSCSEGTFVSVSLVYSSDDDNLTRVVENVPCALFLLHKSCAELPPQIPNPTNPNKFLQLGLEYSDLDFLMAEKYSYDIKHCDICGIKIPWKPKKFFYSGSNFYVCLKCVMFQTQQSLEDPKFKHPAHDHLLSLIQHPSSFRCYACDSDDNIKDMSYRCTKCQFWMHKTCADAPTPFRFQFHDKHPLILSFSLPRVYHKHPQHCRLCNQTLSRLVWLYCCLKCRYFAHFQCARSSQLISSSENEIDDSELLHLPVADELSGYVLGEQLVKAMSLVNNNSSTSSTNSIKHWAHPEHFLQLMNVNELNNHKDDDGISLLCDGCVKPIRTDNDQFYGCALCKFFLHKFCAELPKEIEHYIKPVAASKYREPYSVFNCRGCGVYCNGIFFDFGPTRLWGDETKLHIGCMTLPILIKHKAHPHKLKHVLVGKRQTYCKACGNYLGFGSRHNCEQCDYDICGACVMKASVVKHPWDPHPLHLIYDPGMVMNDHEHEFSCEFCSEDIDTNYWFYHCSDCDLSFHLQDSCFEKSSYRKYSNVKFGATDIIIDELHPHSLTFVLNKKVRSCKICHKNQLGEPVLECAVPCKSIFCRRCIENVTGGKQVALTSEVLESEVHIL